MSETKFMPGPWKCSKKFDFVVVRENEEEIADASYGECPQANTSLIAAAPDLYEALEAVISYGAMTGADWVSDKVYAALAKARGES